MLDGHFFTCFVLNTRAHTVHSYISVKAVDIHLGFKPNSGQQQKKWNKWKISIGVQGTFPFCCQLFFTCQIWLADLCPLIVIRLATVYPKLPLYLCNNCSKGFKSYQFGQMPSWFYTLCLSFCLSEWNLSLMTLSMFRPLSILPASTVGYLSLAFPLSTEFLYLLLNM